MSPPYTCFDGLAYHRHRRALDGATAMLECGAKVGEFSLKGIDLVRFGADGRAAQAVAEFEAMVRPFKGLEAPAEAMQEQLARPGVGG